MALQFTDETGEGATLARCEWFLSVTLDETQMFAHRNAVRITGDAAGSRVTDEHSVAMLAQYDLLVARGVFDHFPGLADEYLAIVNSDDPGSIGFTVDGARRTRDERVAMDADGADAVDQAELLVAGAAGDPSQPEGAKWTRVKLSDDEQENLGIFRAMRQRRERERLRILSGVLTDDELALKARLEGDTD